MSPILGILASSSPSVGDFESIATVTVGAGGAASVTFSSIPSTFTHLQIRGIMRDQRATYGNSGSSYSFNGDNANNYSWHSMQGDGSTATARNATTTYRMATNSGAARGAPTNTFGAIVVDILDYANTSKFKTARALSGVDINGTVSGYGGVIELVSGNWRSTSAITSITITPENPNYVQYSQFALYGIK